MYFQSNRQGLEAKGKKRCSGASVLYSWHLSFGQRCLSSFREAHHVPHRLFELHKWTPTGDSADTTCCTVAGTAGTERTRCSCLVPQGGSKLGSVLEPKGWSTMELIATSKDMCALKTHIIHLIQHIFLTNHMPYARKLFSRVDTLLLLAIETWSGTSPALRHSSYTHKEQSIRIYGIRIFLDVYTFTLYPLYKYLSVCIHTLNFANILQI